MIANWQREIAAWCPRLRVLKYHGSEAERAEVAEQLRARGGAGVDVVLATYNLFEGESLKKRSERNALSKRCAAGPPTPRACRARACTHRCVVHYM